MLRLVSFLSACVLFSLFYVTQPGAEGAIAWAYGSQAPDRGWICMKAVNRPTLQAAEEAAKNLCLNSKFSTALRDQCRKNVQSFHRQCVVCAVPRKGVGFGWGKAAQEPDAIKAALAECDKTKTRGSSECRVGKVSCDARDK